jgi:hypothetical protein
MKQNCLNINSPGVKRIKNSFARFLLPWIAAVLTRIRYTDTRSRFLDQLLVASEDEDGC